MDREPRTFSWKKLFDFVIMVSTNVVCPSFWSVLIVALSVVSILWRTSTSFCLILASLYFYLSNIPSTLSQAIAAWGLKQTCNSLNEGYEWWKTHLCIFLCVGVDVQTCQYSPSPFKYLHPFVIFLFFDSVSTSTLHSLHYGYEWMKKFWKSFLQSIK